MVVSVAPLEPDDRDWVQTFIAAHWGADAIAVHGTLYAPSALPGFIARLDGQRVGLITYQIGADACEIVTLDSVAPGHGVGTTLVEAMVAAARRAGCARVWLVTTNDNLNALRFYQKRGFALVAVHRDAVTAARALKPNIPLIGADGIPIRDEIELERTLVGPAQP